MKTELLVILSLFIMLLFTTNGSPVFVFSSSLPSASPSSLTLITNSSFNNNHQSLQPSPNVNAGPSQVVTAGSTVILNGSNSRAPNGLILSYSWKQIPTEASDYFERSEHTGMGVYCSKCYRRYTYEISTKCY